MKYEVWRYFEYDKSVDMYRKMELIYKTDVLTASNFALAIFVLGRMSGLRELTPKMNAAVDTNGGHAKFGVEFVDKNGKPEYWCVVEKGGEK